MNALSLILALAAGQPAAPVSPASAFQKLEGLVGTWHVAGETRSPLRIRFYTTAGGTVLVEEWRRGDAPHSLTLYHLDGGALLATHYCPQGNQPRLALVSSDAPILRFAFRDATDLDPRESHQHELAFDLSDPAQPVRSEIYRSSSGDEPSRLTLARD